MIVVRHQHGHVVYQADCMHDTGTSGIEYMVVMPRMLEWYHALRLVAADARL